MTAIAATTSPSIGAALAALISGGSNASDGGSSGSPSNASPSGSTPQYGVSVATNVTLSDHAKSVLAQAKVDQVLAQQLSAQVAAGRSGGSGSQPVTLQSIEQIVASAQQAQAATSSSQQAAASSTPATSSDDAPAGSEDALTDAEQSKLQSLFASHKNANGTYGSFNVTESDVTVGTQTQADQAEWYNSIDASSMLQEAQYALANPSTTTAVGIAQAQGFIQAYQNHTIVIQSASDVAGLNFHNTVVYQGGENGGSFNGTYTYNKSAAIFQDPTTRTIVDGDGLVVSWKVAQPTPASS